MLIGEVDFVGCMYEILGDVAKSDRIGTVDAGVFHGIYDFSFHRRDHFPFGQDDHGCTEFLEHFASDSCGTHLHALEVLDGVDLLVGIDPDFRGDSDHEERMGVILFVKDFFEDLLAAPL